MSNERRKRSDKTPIFGEPLLDLYRKVKEGGPECDGIDSDTLQTFYSKSQTVQEQVIADFCSKCPVIEPCLRIGIETQSPGIWGGKTEDQRKL